MHGRTLRPDSVRDHDSFSSLEVRSVYCVKMMPINSSWNSVPGYMISAMFVLQVRLHNYNSFSSVAVPQGDDIFITDDILDTLLQSSHSERLVKLTLLEPSSCL